MSPDDATSTGSGESPSVDPLLLRSLEEAQRLGFLGSRPIDQVVEHARYFVDALGVAGGFADGSVLDLGAGGGVPGLVIAHDVPGAHLTLLDRRATRTDFLARAVHRLRWNERVDVLTQDAARPSPMQRASFDAVVARGFGPPSMTLELARLWVRAGGLIIVSEPPTGDRWAAVDLDRIGVDRVPSERQVAVFVAR